jgi:deazaflavin-dependent oxidoreductase (nitroreductase family)
VKATDLVVRFAFMGPGAAFDRFVTRHTGHSPVIWFFGLFDDAPYNVPILLVTKGRRSGLERRAVLPIFDAGEGRVAIVGSRGGSAIDPHWAHNLRANPEAEVFYRRERLRVRVHLAEGEERERLWKPIAERAPIYDGYQASASRFGRQIPVFVLERQDGRPLRAD